MRRRRREAYDVWPAVADSLLGILAIVAFLSLGRDRPLQEVEDLKGQIEKLVDDEQFSELVKETQTTAYEARLVFTQDSLSFSDCLWDLDEEKQNSVRKVFSEIGSWGKTDCIERISIEGHADSRRLNCKDVQPFRDNLQLSQNRARAVYNVLMGLAPMQPRGLQEILDREEGAVPVPIGLEYLRELNVHGELLVAGFGDRRPRAPADSPLNRRVEVVFKLEEPQRSSSSGVARAHECSDRSMRIETRFGQAVP